MPRRPRQRPARPAGPVAAGRAAAGAAGAAGAVGGARAVGGRGAGQRLGQPVAVGLAHAEVGFAPGRQLVRLVEDDQVVGGGGRIGEPAERALAGQGVDAGDDQVAAGRQERVAGAGIGAAGDAERQPEQGPHLPLPVADQPRRRHDQHAADQPPRQHLAHVQAGHDRLAGAGVVGQQEAQGRLPQHLLVDGDALVRQRVDQRGLGGERGIDQMPIGQPVRLRHRGHRARFGAEVQPRRY